MSKTPFCFLRSVWILNIVCRTTQMVLDTSNAACVCFVNLNTDDWLILFYASLLLYYPSIILHCDGVSQIAVDVRFNYNQTALQMANIDKRVVGVVGGCLSLQETNTALSLLAHVSSVLSKLGINHLQRLFTSSSKQQRIQYQELSGCTCFLILRS